MVQNTSVDPENGPKWFPIPKNIGFNTKIKSLVCSEPSYNFTPWSCPWPPTALPPCSWPSHSQDWYAPVINENGTKLFHLRQFDTQNQVLSNSKLSESCITTMISIQQLGNPILVFYNRSILFSKIWTNVFSKSCLFWPKEHSIWCQTWSDDFALLSSPPSIGDHLLPYFKSGAKNGTFLYSASI